MTSARRNSMLADLWKLLKLAFTPLKDRRCADCINLRRFRGPGLWHGRLKCTSSCGNNFGRPCRDWWPADRN